MKSAAVLAGGAGLAAGAWLYAALYPPSQLFGRTILAGDDPNEIALTYDDGPNPAATPELLELLARCNLRATFFLIGGFVRQQPALTREIAAAGHVIGNHSMTHPWLAWQSAARIRAELAGCNAAIEDLIGKRVKLFRPPHGARRPAVFRAAGELGLSVVQWNVIAYDWRPSRNAVQIADSVQQGIARNRRNHRGSNILLHDGGDIGLDQPRMNTVIATETIIRRSRSSGLRFVTPEAWL